jgi:DNA-binding transcriptional LysR family regulator
VMHRFLLRLFDGEIPPVSYFLDGAEVGKLMVADGLGVTLLPDYSVGSDPLWRSGSIVTRPLRGKPTAVQLVLQSRSVRNLPSTVRDLHMAIVSRAGDYRQVTAAAA